MRNFSLNGENVLDRPVVAIGPTVRTGLRIDQLSCNAHTLTSSADTSFKEIVHAELARYPTYVDGLALVLER